MAITSPWGDWFPLEGLERLRRDLSHSLGHGVRHRAAGASLRISEDPEGMTIDVEIPGVEPGTVDLSATGDMITLKSERMAEDLPDGTHTHQRERWSGAFTRSVAIPGGFDAQRIDATCHDGLLTMRLPRRESAMPKRIAVRKL
jgi:HSP20 family protein